MTSVDARCTQCGSRHASDNYVTYTVPVRELQYSGRVYGTERIVCPECGEETLHNRCASSVPTTAR